MFIKEKHFTDSLAFEVQQAIEKALKAVFAYWDDAIPKTHSLVTLFRYASAKVIKLKTINPDDILAISDYYENDRYHGPRYAIPEREEVEYFYSIAETIFKTIHNAITKRET